MAAHATPFLIFREGVVFPFFAPLASAWLTAIAAASYQHFVVRRALRASETERHRYQQAIHFVTHEMRTPLTAIQGSSELMGRYNLSEEKRKQFAEMINMESKRLARMIQTLLRRRAPLRDGQMELKQRAVRGSRDRGSLRGPRAPLAERKNIRILTQRAGRKPRGRPRADGIRHLQPAHERSEILAGRYPGHGRVPHRRRLNCVSRSKTRASAWTPKSCARSSRSFIAPSAPKPRAKWVPASVFPSWSRSSTITAGKMEVTSQPGQGSCFTVVFPAAAREAAAPSW